MKYFDTKDMFSVEYRTGGTEILSVIVSRMSSLSPISFKFSVILPQQGYGEANVSCLPSRPRRHVVLKSAALFGLCDRRSLAVIISSVILARARCKLE